MAGQDASVTVGWGRRRLARWCAVAVVGCVLVLVLLEIGLRYRRPGQHLYGEHPYMVGDPLVHHRTKANIRTEVGGEAFVTNSLGLRDREVTRPKPAAVFRILMLGDSFTQGGGLPLEATVAKRVEAALNGHGCRTTVEVVNAGVASYSPILEYLQLKHVGLGLQPDLVTLNFDMTDVHDDWVRTSLARFDGDGLPLAVSDDRRRETALLLPPLPKPAVFRVFNPIERAVNRLALYQELRGSRLGEWMFGPLRLTPERLATLGLAGDPQYDIEAIARDVDSPKLREAWGLTERYVVATSRLARAHGAAFVLVVYPHAQQIAADDSGLHSSTRPFEILEALGRREGFPVINLLALFRARERRGDPLFRTDDIYYTRTGARVLAQGVADGLDRLRLVPCGRPIR